MIITSHALRGLAVDSLGQSIPRLPPQRNRAVEQCLVTVVESHCSFARRDRNLSARLGSSRWNLFRTLGIVTMVIYFVRITFCFESSAEPCMPQMVVLHVPWQQSHSALFLALFASHSLGSSSLLLLCVCPYWWLRAVVTSCRTAELYVILLLFNMHVATSRTTAAAEEQVVRDSAAEAVTALTRDVKC